MNIEELKDNWKSQTSDHLPDIVELMHSIRKKSNEMRTKLLVAAILLCCVIVTFALIWLYIPFDYPMTQVALLAMGLMICLAIGFMFYYRAQIPSSAAELKDVKVYIGQWITYQEKQKTYSRSFLYCYFITITIGMAVFLYEVTQGDMLFRLLAYSSTGIWLGVVWFYFKPKWERTTQDKIQEVIDAYRSIADQL